MATIRLLTKATLLIDRLARVGDATPAELARELDEPRPSVYRIVASLEETGHVRGIGGGRLELGPALLRLGDAAVSAVVDRAALQGQLRSVREQLGVGAFFSVRRGEVEYCLDRVDGSDVDLQFLVPGRALPAGGFGPGLSTVQVPVPGSDGEDLGTVAVIGISDRLDPQADVARTVLTDVAAEIARLGTEKCPAPVTDGVTDRRSSSAVVKAADLMAVLEAERTATPARLAEATGEPVSSVYRMLATLAEVGWVEQAGARGPYRVGMKLLLISECLLQRRDIRTVAAPFMREIHDLTGETTFLCVRHSGSAVCIERFDGVRVNSRVLQLGMSMPLHVGAAPRALLAFRDREAWEEYAAGVESRGDRWQGVSSRAGFFLELEEARAAGYVVSDDTVTPGIAAVGVPVFNHRGEVVASLSVSGLREGILSGEVPGADGRSVVDLVRGAGQRISAALGAPAGVPDAVCAV